jgi:[acyl-carrier-protein] S-malonyltransferase
MHAIIGLTIDKVQKLVDEVKGDGVVSVANHNTEHQIVITGTPELVEKVSSLAVSQEARAVPLKVSGAWHSELIKGAEDEFRDFLNTVSFNSPEKIVIHNVTADFGKDSDEIKTIMARQLCNPVRWYDSIQRLFEEKVEIFAEVGPGRVLTGLLKKIVPENYPCRIYNINSLKNMEKFLKET